MNDHRNNREYQRQRLRRICVLAWGSLKWDRRQLVVSGGWHEDGPTVPLEFSRRSSDGRLTLVIDRDHGDDCQSGWFESGLLDLDAAIVNLADREGTGTIGLIDKHGRPERGRDEQTRTSIRGWLGQTDFDAAIWTDLKSNFEEKVGQPFTVASAMSYLQELRGDQRNAAWEYLERAPATVQTPLRRRLVAEGAVALRRD